MDLAEKICVVCCVLYNMVDVVTVSLLTVELPKILNPDCINSTLDYATDDDWVACEKNSWEQPGIVIAASHIASVFFSIPVGHLTSRFNSRYIFLIGLLTHAAGGYILAINDAVGGGFVFLVLGTFFDGAGCTIGAVTFTDVLRKIFPKDSTRCRILNVVGLARVIGYSSGFFLGTLAYESIGSVLTFNIISTLFVLQALAMIFALYLDRQKSTQYKRLRVEEKRPLKRKHDIWAYDAVEKQETKDFSRKIQTKIEPKIDKHYKAVFMNVPTMTLCAQYFFTHFAVATVMATAPSRLQIEVGFTAVENGLMIGLALIATFITMLILLIVVKNNFYRVISMMVFIGAEIVGLATYPFTWSFGFALFSETCIHMARNALNSFGSSILMLIADNGNLDYGKANGIYIQCRYSSQAVGSFFSVFLLELMGFRNMYFLLVGCLIPVMLVSLIYFRLMAKQ